MRGGRYDNCRWRRAGGRSIGAAVALALILVTGGSVRATELVSWMYDAEVVVADQQSDSRQQASADALRQVLTRVTGLTTLPDHPALEAALETPDRLITRFGFRSEWRDQQRVQLMDVQFTPSGIQQLVRTAGLPVWGSRRPIVHMLMASDEGGELRVHAAGTEPLAKAAQTAARERGVPLRIPDELQIEGLAVNRIWRATDADLVEVAQSLGGDAMLRVGVIEADALRTRVVLVQGEEVRRFYVQGDDAPTLVRAAVERVATQFASRLAVAGGTAGALPLVVRGIGGARDYAALMNYLMSLEYLEDVAVVALDQDTLELRVATAADALRLTELFTEDRRLLLDESSLEAVYLWQG